MWMVAALVAGAGVLGSSAMAAAPVDELDSALLDLLATDQRGGSLARAAEGARLRVTPGERVSVDVYVEGDVSSVAARLRDASFEERARGDGPPVAVVSGRVGVDRLEEITRVPGVRAVVPVERAGTDVGAVTSQGEAAHRAPAIRALGITGAGIKVGVISDSINQVGTKLAGSQATGDLPAAVQVLSDDTVDADDEGRAMAEIIYDMAPGITQMAFASGTAAGAAGKAAAIDALVGAGVKIIADDIFYLREPFFQDGQVAQAVDRARDAGVLYLASAGNRARQSYESAPAFLGGAGTFHDFDPGAAVDTTQTLATVPAGDFAQVALQWDEPWGVAKRNVDLEIVRISDGSVLRSAVTNNLTSGLPSEVATWTNTTGAAVQVGVRIRLTAVAAGALPALTRLKYIAQGDFGAFTIAEHDTSSDTINPDAAAARGSLAVAAVRFNDAGLNDPRAFSSRGLKTRLFSATGVRLAVPEVRQKPQLAAADGVATTVPGFTSFSGTSASTPSAAGIAALAWSLLPSRPLAEIRAALTNPGRASDCTLPGLPDADCGFGFVFADGVLAAFDPSAPAVTPVITPAAPTGANGWWTGPVSVAWSVADGESPFTVQSGCAAAAVDADGVASFACQARSVGGVTTAPAVTVRRDTTPPARPGFVGFGGGVYSTATFPPASIIGCASADGGSGLASCTVSGYDASIGAHTLTATARDNAGLTATSTVAYTVVRAQPVAGASGSRRPTAASVVTLRSSKRCVKRGARLRVRIKRPPTGAIRSVRVTMTGVKRAKTRRNPGTITLAKLRRTRTTVRVTVVFTGGRTSSTKRTYRRCR